MGRPPLKADKEGESLMIQLAGALYISEHYDGEDVLFYLDPSYFH